MKFSEMPYERPCLEELKKQMAEKIGALKEAGSYEEAKAVFMEMEALSKHIQTKHNIAKIRYDIDTRDRFYEEEMDFWNKAMPELQEYQQQWTKALLEGAFCKEFEAEFGSVMFLNARISLKTFSPEKIGRAHSELQSQR